jgi:hypothetical protein
MQSSPALGLVACPSRFRPRYLRTAVGSEQVAARRGYRLRQGISHRWRKASRKRGLGSARSRSNLRSDIGQGADVRVGESRWPEMVCGGTLRPPTESIVHKHAYFRKRLQPARDIDYVYNSGRDLRGRQRAPSARIDLLAEEAHGTARHGVAFDVRENAIMLSSPLPTPG